MLHDWLIPLERILVLAWLLGLLVLGLRALHRAGTLRPSPRGALLAALALALLAARLSLPGALIHANAHGYALLQVMFSFPDTHTTHADYGQSSFTILGLATILMGDRPGVVFFVNSLFGVGILWLAASLAQEVTGRRAAFFVALAAGALLPVFVRVAASEDSHNIAVFFGVLALWSLVRARRRGALSPSSLLAPVLALLLAFYGRQGMVAFPLLFALLLPWREWRVLLASQAVRAGTALVLGLLLLRFLGARGEVASSAFLTILLALPLLASPDMWARHPLFESPSLAVLLLCAAGLVLLLRRDRPRVLLVLWLGAGLYFLLTWGTIIHPGHHVQFGMRLPLFALLLTLAGAGGAVVVDAVARHRRRRLLVAVSALAVLAPLPGYFDLFAHRDQEMQEIESVARRAGELLPDDLIIFPHDRDLPGYPRGFAENAVFPDHVTALVGQTVDWCRASAAPSRVLVYRGTICNLYSALTVRGIPPEWVRPSWKGFLAGLDILEAVWERPAEGWRRFSGVEPPAELRPECESLPAGLKGRFVPWERIRFTLAELPYTYFPRTELLTGVWVIDEPEMVGRALTAYRVTLRSGVAEPSGTGAGRRTGAPRAAP